MTSLTATAGPARTEPAVPSIQPGTDRQIVATTFGSVVRELRRQKGLSQEELAKRGDFDRTYTSLLERGLRTPTLTVIYDLALALEVHPATLVHMGFDEYVGSFHVAPNKGLLIPAKAASSE